jgi:hypothetical protein
MGQQIHVNLGEISWPHQYSGITGEAGVGAWPWRCAFIPGWCAEEQAHWRHQWRVIEASPRASIESAQAEADFR